MFTIAEIVRFLKSFAPLEAAAEWDNVGLLLGDEAGKVDKIMACLTVTAASAAEAVKAGAQLIVSHHPILFRGVKRLTAANAEGRMLLDLARAGIAVYSPHTAFDNTVGGINDLLARRLGLEEIGPLQETAAAQNKCKVVVFVPDTDLNNVADAMFAAGAGRIGQYSECSFRLPGTGTFFGGDASNPTIGQKGRREEVSEWRLEAVCTEADADNVVAAMRRAHSYEEPAYDVYRLRTSPTGNAGVGRLGRFPQPVSLTVLAACVKQALGAQSVQTVGDPARPIQRLAIVCGAGGEFVREAARKKADALLTGEARFHDCLEAEASGIALILPGHFASERPGVEHLADLLAKNFPQVQVWPSKSEADPLVNR